MSTEAALLAAIRRDPDEDRPRLLYADWLQQHGQPARAELVRIQCHLAQLPRYAPQAWPLRQRELDLSAQLTLRSRLPSVPGLRWGFSRSEVMWGFGGSPHPERSLQPTHPPQLLTRGVVEGITLRRNHRGPLQEGCTAEDFDWLVDRVVSPVGCLRRVDVDEPLARVVVESRSMAEVIALAGQFQEDTVARLAADPQITKLQELVLEAPEAAHLHLLRSADLSSLRRLDVQVPEGFNRGEAVVRQLADCASLAGLSDLTVGINRIEASGFLALANSSVLTRLRQLSLSGYGVLTAATAALLTSPNVIRLQKLDLHNDAGGRAMLQALADSPYLSSLRALSLNFTRVGEVGAEILAGSANLQDLACLDLAHGRIAQAGVEALARSPYLRSLLVLNLAHNQVGGGLEAIANSEQLSSLRALNLAGSQYSGEELLPLAETPCLRNLEQLVVTIARSPLPATIAQAMVSNPALKNLRRLHLLGNHPATAPALRLLRDHFGRHAVTVGSCW